MVCLGNICRSPLAHGVMQHFIQQEGLNWTVDSAGTGSWHIGEAPDRRAIAVAKKYGVDISAQRGQQFNARHFDEYDLIFVMDRNNLSDVLRLAKTAEHRAKVKLFLEDDAVPDPYYDSTMFESVYQLVEKRSKELLRILNTQTS